MRRHVAPSPPIKPPEGGFIGGDGGIETASVEGVCMRLQCVVIFWVLKQSAIKVTKHVLFEFQECLSIFETTTSIQVS